MSSDKDEDSALHARRDKLAAAIKIRRAAAPTPASRAPKGPDSMSTGMSLGLRAGSEFVSAIVVGGLIGWGFDWLLHTKPIFTIVFFLLGVVAGVWNVIRATSPKGAEQERPGLFNSPLSGAKAEDKDVPREPPSGA